MLSVKIDEKNLVAILEPEGPLSESDFQLAAKTIDPLIEQCGRLKGIIIHTKFFPGWQSFAALASHLKFVRDHHRKVARIALVTDSILGDFAEPIASHFVQAEIKLFPYQQFNKANSWIIENNQHEFDEQ